MFVGALYQSPLSKERIPPIFLLRLEDWVVFELEVLLAVVVPVELIDVDGVEISVSWELPCGETTPVAGFIVR
jgi:hypothetical protein